MEKVSRLGKIKQFILYILTLLVFVVLFILFSWWGIFGYIIFIMLIAAYLLYKKWDEYKAICDYGAMQLIRLGGKKNEKYVKTVKKKDR